MKRFVIPGFIAILIMLVSMVSLVFAQTTTTPLESVDMSGVVGLMSDAFQSGNWFAVGSLVVMVIVWFISKYVDNPVWYPIISASVGMIFGIATGALEGKLPWYTCLVQGLITGTSASWFWSVVGKRILPKKT